MNGCALAIKRLTGKERSRALRVIGARLAAAVVLSTTLVAAGGPVTAGRLMEQAAPLLDTAQAEGDNIDTEGLPAEEELATEDEADVEKELATEDAVDVEEEVATEEEADAEEELATEEEEAAAEEEAAKEDLLAAYDTTVAAARVDDSFNVFTDNLQSHNDRCGKARFVDYGPGKPGGGNNDDYIRIRDRCKDGFGVRAYAWLNGVYLGKKSNVKGKGSSIVWDPFRDYGNVRPRDRVGITVCLINSKGDTTPFYCASRTVRSQDG